MLHRKSTAVLFLTFFLLFSLGASARTYYVSSSTGNDSNSGTDPSSPWRSLNKLNSFNFAPGDNILFKRGDTFYGSISISESGTSGSPITFSAYGSGDKPEITGFTSVSSWTNIGGNIWESSSSVSNLQYTNMVVVNGKNTAMGRYPNCTTPNTGYLTIKSHSGNSSVTAASGLSGTNWTGASIVIRKQKYDLQRGTVTGQSGSTIYYKDAGGDPINGYGFFIQNDARTLDINGEWYYNPSTKKIRIYSTSYPSNVKVASVENLIHVWGANVTFDNLNLTGANSYAISATYSSMQHVVIQNCDIQYSGIEAIYSDQPYITIQNNNISDANSDGIKIVQPNATVKNNTINSINVFEGMGQDNSTGGICVTGANATVQNNNLVKCGFKGIVFNGLNSKIVNNLINTFCFVREDGAGIYTGNSGSAGSIIDGNIILNGLGAKNGTLDSLNNDLSGISVDDYGTGITISNNTIANCVAIGIKLHKANNIVVKNNTTYNNGNSSWSKGGIEILYNSSYPISNISLSGNILFAKTSEQLPLFASSPSGNDGIKALKSDNNYYAKPIETNSVIKVNGSSFDLANWKSYTGQDANSKIAPKTITDLNDLKFEYNATSQSKTIALDAAYIDAKGNKFDGSITLSPYSSAVLIKSGASSSLLPAVYPANAVNGLDYKYYEASSYDNLPDFTEVTPVKSGAATDFDISSANRSNSYSFNFTGFINVPTDGQYTFYTSSDDGSQLFIDNVPVVDNDGLHGTVEKSGSIGLKAGKHAITVGYFQESGDNILSVDYSGPGVSKQAIPKSSLYRVAASSNLHPAVNPANTINGLNYKYYEASSYTELPDFNSGSPVKTGISHDFDISSANRNDRFSFNFTGYIDVPEDGQYTFYTSSDDGSNLYIDNVLVVDNDGLHSATEKSGSIGLKAGKHSISVGFFEQDGDNTLSVSYAGPGINKQVIPSNVLYKVANYLPAVNPSNTVGGLNYSYYEASYYNSLPNFNSFTPVKTGSSNTFDLSVAKRSTSYSLNYTGYIDIPADGQYTFYTTSDDGSNLYVDNILVVDNDGLHSALEKSGIIELKAGKHAISVGFFQQTGDDVLSVSYESADIAKQSIPASSFYRNSSAALGEQTMINTSTGMMFENDSTNFQMGRLLNHETTPGVKVYPNPFKNSIQIDVNGGAASKFKLALTDASGRIVWTKDVENYNSSYHESVNTSTLPIGVYFLSLIRDNKSSVTKLVKEY